MQAVFFFFILVAVVKFRWNRQKAREYGKLQCIIDILLWHRCVRFKQKNLYAANWWWCCHCERFVALTFRLSTKRDVIVFWYVEHARARSSPCMCVCVWCVSDRKKFKRRKVKITSLRHSRYVWLIAINNIQIYLVCCTMYNCVESSFFALEHLCGQLLIVFSVF